MNVDLSRVAVTNILKDHLVEGRTPTVRVFIIAGVVSLVLVTFAISMKGPTQAQEQNAKPAPASGQKEGTTAPMMVSFSDLKWTALPERPGMQFAILSGDPRTGAYTQMRKVPAGTDNGLHSHSSEIKNVIISGVWYTGTDAASAKDFGPGSVVLMPGNWAHVSGCRAGSDCVFYQEGKGKFDFKPSQTKPSERP